MIREQADVAIVGAGFAGSLMALVLSKIGRRSVLVERGVHPRFAIGESSTPLANLLLEQIAHTYELDWLAPLTKYGTWQQSYAQLPVGLKRGFSFFAHRAGQPFEPRPDHVNELLVAASPSDAAGDTHWFREQFDQFMVGQVEAAGIPYYDRAEISRVERTHDWVLHGSREGQPLQVRASFLIDATGPAGMLTRELGIGTRPGNLRTNSWSIYSHFVDVDLWANVLDARGSCVADHPYPCDSAALHHVLDEGWMWVLRFNNGVTSAGLMFDGERRMSDGTITPEAKWQMVLGQYPAIAHQFERARPVQPWIRTGRLQRRATSAVGDGWAMLSHSAYFIDALFSAGNAHTLFCVERLAEILESHWGRDRLAQHLAEYERKLLREVEFLDWLVHGSYRTFCNFKLFCAYSMYYFAAAIHSEEQRRLGQASDDDEFLFSHDSVYRNAVERGYRTALQLVEINGTAKNEPIRRFQEQVARDIQSINRTGLCDPARQNMYAYV